MNVKVKEHKWLVWVMVISLVFGMWSGSVARGEGKGEEKSPGETEQVREITRVELGMNELVEGELVERKNLPSEVTVQEVQVESPAIETISTESVTVETETISWSRRKDKGEGFQKINDWKKHRVENNTEYKVEMTLNTEGCIFKDRVEVCMGAKPGEVKIVEEEKTSVRVSWEFTVGNVPETKPTPSPSTPPPSPSATPTQTPSGTETPVPTEEPSPDTPPIETTSPTVPPTPSPGVTPTRTPDTTETPVPTEEPHPDTPPIESSLPLVTPSLSPSLVPPTTYTVKLEANGGAVSQKSISFTAEELSNIKLPEPKREKYVFIGWYEGKKRVAKLTEPRNLTLKAQWVTASVEMGYLGTFKWEKFKLSPDVKLTEVSIEKKYKKFVKINNKKKTLKGKKKKYFEKAKLTLKIDGKDVKGVVLKMKLPEPKIEKKRVVYRKRYVIGVYTTYKLTYTYKPGATKVVAEYSYKRNGKYKKLKALSRRKGGSVSVKKGRTVYMRVKIYYGKNAYSESERKPLKG